MLETVFWRTYFHQFREAGVQVGAPGEVDLRRQPQRPLGVSHQASLPPWQQIEAVVEPGGPMVPPQGNPSPLSGLSSRPQENKGDRRVADSSGPSAFAFRPSRPGVHFRRVAAKPGPTAPSGRKSPGPGSRWRRRPANGRSRGWSGLRRPRARRRKPNRRARPSAAPCSSGKHRR